MKGDFLGFSFDGIHCSQLGLTRVSDGDRYSESLLPENEDIIVPIPGGDGNYYFGSQYRSKPFTISVAFDSVSEEQFRKIVKLFSTKKPRPLIFDERPYKVYTVKINTPPQLNYICFDEPRKYVDEEVPVDGVRIIRENGGWEREKVYPYQYGEKARTYKGEGTIEFIAVYPFARQQFKILEQYGPFNSTFYKDGQNNYMYNLNVPRGNLITEYTNVDEWAAASRILCYDEFVENNIDSPQATDIVGFNMQIPVYNAGDIASPFYLYLPYNNLALSGANGTESIQISLNGQILQLKNFTSKKSTMEEENGVIINTYNHLIEGVVYNTGTASWRTTGNIYNEYIEAGDFGTIPARDFIMDNSHYAHSLYINCATAENARIHYNYLYY